MIKKTLSLIVIMVLLFAAAAVFAQKSPITNHLALYVKDLDKSAAFYKNVMMLKEISDPFHDGKHVWLRTGKHSQLHLILGAAEVMEHDINSHFAYSVKNLQPFIEHLEKMNVKYGDYKRTSKLPTVRPDGVKQVYLQDPDNYWLEVNDDKF